MRAWRGHSPSRRWLGASSVSLAALASVVGVIPTQEPPRHEVRSVAKLALAPRSDSLETSRSASRAEPTTTTTTAAPAPTPAAPPWAPSLPSGKGMWLHRFQEAAGGDPNGIVAQAQRVGLTHVYVRLGSSKSGFYAKDDLDRLLPVAHRAGLKVIGWDFPYLFDPEQDAQRSYDEVAYTTPDGHRIDAFAADIETRAEGTNLAEETVSHYSDRLRQLVGPDYPLIAAVPRYNPTRFYPYNVMAKYFDAFAPMVYWINRDPATDVAGSVDALKVFGKPIIPVGQAYDPAVDGHSQYPNPGRAQIDAFIKTAAARGVTGVSFWSWSTANDEHWATISDDRSFG